MVAMWPDIDGIVCANDLIALGAHQSLLADGWDVPGRVGISGFDDTIIASTGGLTSVRQPLTEMATRAVALAQAEQPSDAEAHVVLGSELVVRASTGG